MLSLLAAVALVPQSMPDTALRLMPGDQWTSEYTYQFKSEDIDLINVETTSYSVAKEGSKLVLTAKWMLRESKVDGETVPVPKATEPIVIKVNQDGETKSDWINEDIARHRIERVLQIERKGSFAEPSFFPTPPNVRLVGLDKKITLEPNRKEKTVLAVSAGEAGIDRPIKASGYYSLEPKTGILEDGHWTIFNCPIPGGTENCELSVTLRTKDLKLAVRK